MNSRKVSVGLSKVEKRLQIHIVANLSSCIYAGLPEYITKKLSGLHLDFSIFPMLSASRFHTSIVGISGICMISSGKPMLLFFQ
jgi:hypothetical protein